MSARDTNPAYGSRSVKRSRRTRAEIEALREAIVQTLETDRPMTVRQLYYRLVSAGAIDKTEAEYRGVVRLTGLMRREGAIPYGWIADATRWQRKPTTHSSLKRALQITAETYRRSIWANQSAYVEIWLEKEALAGVLWPVTSEWDVPLMVCRGYPSLSFLHTAAETIRAWNRPTFLYYLGDRDPSGLDIPRTVEREIRGFAPKVDLTFDRIAVTEEQIEALGLPTRPTKKTDTRSKNFIGGSVEVDAIPPAMLREIVDDAITDHIDERSYESLMAVEEAERETLSSLIAEGGW